MLLNFRDCASYRCMSYFDYIKSLFKYITDVKVKVKVKSFIQKGN